MRPLARRILGGAYLHEAYLTRLNFTEATGRCFYSNSFRPAVRRRSLERLVFRPAAGLSWMSRNQWVDDALRAARLVDPRFATEVSGFRVKCAVP